RRWRRVLGGSIASGQREHAQCKFPGQPPSPLRPRYLFSAYAHHRQISPPHPGPLPVEGRGGTRRASFENGPPPASPSPLTGRGVDVFPVCAFFEKRDEAFPQTVIIRMLYHSLALPRARQRHRQDLAHLRFRTVSHANHPIGEKQGLVHVMCDHKGGYFVLAPELDEDLLEFVARE